MSTSVTAVELLQSADKDLRSVMRALVSAEPDRIGEAQRVLEGLVRSLNDLDSLGRRDPSGVSKKALQSFRATLAQAAVLSRIALGSIELQIVRAGLETADSGFTVQVRG